MTYFCLMHRPQRSTGTCILTHPVHIIIHRITEIEVQQTIAYTVHVHNSIAYTVHVCSKYRFFDGNKVLCAHAHTVMMTNWSWPMRDIAGFLQTNRCGGADQSEASMLGCWPIRDQDAGRLVRKYISTPSPTSKSPHFKTSFMYLGR